MHTWVNRKYLGIFFACASYAIYSLHYATVTWLESDYPLWQLVFMRSVVMVLITLALSRRGTAKAALRSPHMLSLVLRGVLQFIAMACFFLAAREMPLSAVMTLYCTAPLIIVVLSVFLLGEVVRGYRWLALMVGVAGSVIAANPGGAVSAVPALIAFASGLFWALTVVFTRKHGARDSAAVQLLVTGAVFIVLSAALLTWQMPSTLRHWGLIVALGVQVYLAQYCFFEACRLAPASLVGPLEYTSVVWSGVFGYLLFSDIPTLPIVIGAVLVAASGIALAMTACNDARECPA
ncbi:DMT family transporter [Pseudomonas sp. RIT-PI-S]|uniref:DMT family transporter n=1 Tax=Pseudomonas sp. RIT-PI-S TaxID=3035295 RepID=UPI0021D87827|nr:DMT family transporter [Pseudomonas sp. RIT-PI-S]